MIFCALVLFEMAFMNNNLNSINLLNIQKNNQIYQIWTPKGYGSFVLLLKVILPSLALVLIISVILWPILNSQEDFFSVNITKEDRESAKNMQVFNATYSGMMDDSSQFTVTAELMEQTNPNDNMIILTNPKGDLLAADGTWHVFSADQGKLNKKTGTLKMTGNVNAFQDSGLELAIDSLIINFEKNSGYSFDDVTGQGSIGNIISQGLRLHNGGSKIDLLGKSKIIIYNDDKE